jgi:hypothetical protein
VIGRKTSEEIAARFFECKAQNVVGRQAADDLEAKIAALKGEQARLSAELHELTCTAAPQPPSLPPAAVTAAAPTASEAPRAGSQVAAVGRQGACGEGGGQKEEACASSAASSPQSRRISARESEARRAGARVIQRTLQGELDDSLSEWSKEMVGA